jgi:hypothetical protein
MFVSVVVPCYRSAATLPTLVAGLNEVLPAAAAMYEIILVVDGSPDGTWDVAHALAQQHTTVRAIRLARNYGQHNALVAGMRAARFDVIVTMDDDLQHPPSQVPVLLAALTDGVDLVYGLPQAEEHGFFRSLDQVNGPHVSIDVALSWGTTRVSAVEVRMEERASGQSGYTFTMLVRHALNMVLGYSTVPLRLVTYLGFAVGAAGLMLFARLIWLYVVGRTSVAGFTTISAMIAMFSSVQMIAIGVLGEYVGRIHSGGMGRPTYVIRESASSSSPVTARTPAQRG